MTPVSFARWRRSRAAAPLTADACPLLAPGVVFEASADGAPWIAVVQGVPTSRVSPAVVDLLTAMDGATALSVLHRRYAAAESLEDFLELVGRFRRSGLLEGAATSPPGRLSYRAPFTLQIATLRAPALFRRLDRLVIALSPRALLLSGVTLLGAGLVAATLQAEELREVLTMPLPLSSLVILVAVLSLTTLLHESAHGLTLTRFGGAPRRAGFMIFYLTPAFFVDVTDGWRLSDRRQRVAVALAGPAVHAVVAAVALVVAFLVPDQVRQTLQLLGLSCAFVVLLNLIPFVRFDGYLALMSALDEPNLRARAIRDGAEFLSRVLFGGGRARRCLDTWWSAPFGLASLIAPVVLVLFAVARMVEAFAGGGAVLGVLVVALESVVVLVGAAIVGRALREVLRSGVPRIRFFVVCALLAAGTVAAGMLIRFPATATFGFSADGDAVTLLQARTAATVDVPVGAPVVLRSRGIVANEPLGEGHARPQPPALTTASVEAFFPVKVPGDVTVPAVIVAHVDMSAGSGRLPSTGEARVEIGTGNLWQTLWATGVAAPLGPLLHE